PSLKAIRLPMPPPRLSKITRSSPSGTPARRPFRLNGTPINHRAPTMLGWTRDSVTVPITSAMRMAVQLPQGTGHPIGTGGRGGEGGTRDLPDLEEGAGGHLNGEGVGGRAGGRPGRLADRAARPRPQPGHLVGHAAAQPRVGAEQPPADTLASGDALRQRLG